MHAHVNFGRQRAIAYREPDRCQRLARARRGSRTIRLLALTAMAAGLSLQIVLGLLPAQL
ncbi:hypothetical protein ACFOLJ_13535 [Rugamonas sp. CCM 8940]|uniref:hypothetical protein n=1 Tax=Rugamonas sp. CCM 8940 TaxID=2765359 RepID=UPI0018F70FDC|nr:hypothetical protein [Rugamonas sp. CCM 8940]MBJ7311958.1 hypothetical protein [Rugamonas sp. CCM 8940]